MPIDYSKYPDNWHSEIRPRILDRAGHKCEQCGVPNYWFRNNETDEATENEMLAESWAMEGIKTAKIVLTIAHLDDPNPMNCADENLAALCQRCHNRLDAPMRARNRAASRSIAAEQAGQESLIPMTTPPV